MTTTQTCASKAYLHKAMISPQKCRLVADLVRGQKIDDAYRTLVLEKKKPAGILLKLLKSAVANAEQKGTVNLDRLFISDLQVGEGPRSKKVFFRAQGRADVKVTRTSHISLLLNEKIPVKKKATKKAASATTKTAATKKTAAKKKTTKKTSKKTTKAKKA